MKSIAARCKGCVEILVSKFGKFYGNLNEAMKS